MTISRTFWMKLLSVILIVLLLLEAIDARPHKKAKRKHRAKQCGRTGHICQPGSRKLCCTVGYTCRVPDVSSNRTKQKKKRKLGTCQPLELLRVNEREIEDAQPNPSFWL
ncbi:uncharacterized protein LOC144627909 [Oculina patagonica]